MFAQEPPPDFDVPGRREPGERPELVAEVGLVEVACATGEVAPVDRSGGVDREHGGGEAVGAGQPLRRDADELLEPLCQMSAADTGCHAQVADRHRPSGAPEVEADRRWSGKPQVAAMTLLVWQTSLRPAVSHSRRVSSSSSSVSISCGPSAVASRSAAQQWRAGPKPALPLPAGHTARPRASAGTAPAPTA